MEIQPQHTNLESLFYRRLFRIPQYQRAYSWQTKHRTSLFEDIRRIGLQDDGRSHFMATIVGLRRDKRKIIADQYQIVEIVDGQQRITTLILILKAISKSLSRSDKIERRIGEDIDRTLIKADKASLLLLQTNHDRSDHFATYIRTGQFPTPSEAKTLADRELLLAMTECEEFVASWTKNESTLSDLFDCVKNRLTFILHEIDDEALVYSVFEVLNSRGLEVSWFDRLKSMLMAVVFEAATGNERETIDEIHKLWASIYSTIGLRLGLSTESLRFAATLWSEYCPNRALSEEDSVELLVGQATSGPAAAIRTTRWVKAVTEVVDRLHRDIRKSAVTKISHARLVAVAIQLRRDLNKTEKTELLRRWESVTFRIFGMFGRDARTGVGEYVRFAWRIIQERPSFDELMEELAEIGKEYPIAGAITSLRRENCYTGWQEELRYFLYGYEEYLAERAGQKFDSKQWNRIWEANAIDSIEHISPQSSYKRHIHWLGNLTLLPPKLNSTLGARSPKKKCEEYTYTGLLITIDVAKRIRIAPRWPQREVRRREEEMLAWAKQRWAD